MSTHIHNSMLCVTIAYILQYYYALYAWLCQERDPYVYSGAGPLRKRPYIMGVSLYLWH